VVASSGQVASPNEGTEDDVLASAAAEPAALGLREARVRGSTLWVDESVPRERVEWVARGREVGEAVLPGVTGLAAPREPVILYLLADGERFRRLTSQLTGLPSSAIHQFEGGRSYAAGPRRGIYLDAGGLGSADQAARLVAHELVHLAERDALETRAVPRWFSEGLAEYVSQAAMVSVDPNAAAERRWRRAVVVASALHRGAALPLSALADPLQWNSAAAAGYERLIYAQALLAVDWLVGRGSERAPGQVVRDVARDVSFAAALEARSGVAAQGLDAVVETALRESLLPRYPVGVQAFADAGPSGTRFQFAAVGLPPHEVLSRRFTREDGYPARDSGPPAPVGPAGAAFWTFQTRRDSPPATWWLTVEGDQGSRASIPFYVTEPLPDD
jgi:hypothetical protein